MRTLALLLILLSLPSVSFAQDEDTDSNSNERYTVESVDIAGIDAERVSRNLRDRLQSLVGGRLDREEADRLDDQLSAELPEYQVTRRISRGSVPGRIRVVFEVHEAESRRWIRSPPSRSKLVYHSDQGWSGVLDMAFGGGGPRRAHSVTLGLVFDNGDDAIEEYSGFRIGLQSRRLGTRRLGARVEVSLLRQTWRDATLAALAADPSVPEPYRARVVVDPSVTFALTPDLQLIGGASFSRLESLSQSPESQMAAAFIGGIGFNRSFQGDSGAEHDVSASYEARVGAEALASDLDYRRYLAGARYQFEHRDNTIVASGALGYITGRAPLFERFSLGDSATLRGWNKYDVAPAGGRRMVHGSIEYRFHGVALFLDTGSVWDEHVDRRMRLSTGFGFHGEHAFLTVGFPLNSDDAGAAFTMGVRF